MRMPVIVALASLGLLLLLASLVSWPNEPGASAQKRVQEVVQDPASTGRALFLAKGCATCHRHDGAGEHTGAVAMGPDLTHYQPDAAFVRRWLRDPQSVRPRTMMPNLELSEDEIEALLAFLAS